MLYSQTIDLTSATAVMSGHPCIIPLVGHVCL
jgi:hypothetical protein